MQYVSERLKISEALLLTLPAMLPLVPPVPISERAAGDHCAGSEGVAAG